MCTSASSPEGDQSAASTSSTSSFGIPPGLPMRASVPCMEKARVNRGRRRSARSAEDETASRRASVTPSDWGSKLDELLLNSSSGLPSNAALKITRPSGAKRALRTAPSRWVSCWTSG